jgi:hypothetical protein
VSEGAFFVFVLVVGTASLAIVLTSRAVSIEWLSLLTAGVGLWLASFVMTTLICIGTGGLVWTVVRTRTSAERRSAVVRRAKERARRRPNLPPSAEFPGIPKRDLFQELPGTQLPYRLPTKGPSVWRLTSAAMLCLLWVGLTSALAVVVIHSGTRQSPNWLLLLGGIASGYAAFRAVRYFLATLRDTVRIGETILEVSDLPLFPGETYTVFFAQAGNVRFRELELSLVCDEKAIFRDGTSERIERRQVQSQPILTCGTVEVQPGTPISRMLQVAIDEAAVHSFHSPSNGIEWKFVLKGTMRNRGKFEREFPVVVYPACVARPLNG